MKMMVFSLNSGIILHCSASTSLLPLFCRAYATFLVLQWFEFAKSNSNAVGGDSYFNEIKTDRSEYCDNAKDCQVRSRTVDEISVRNTVTNIYHADLMSVMRPRKAESKLLCMTAIIFKLT